MHWIDQKYIMLLSSRLRNFKRKGPANYNFSCPICGDSETDTRKARGYIYEAKNTAYYHCHNICGGMAFSTLLKRLDALLFQQYRIEKLQVDGLRPPREPETDFSTSPTFACDPCDGADEAFKKLKKISQLPHDHPAKKVLNDRCIPNYWHSVFRYTPGFKTFTNSILPKKFEHPDKNDDGRIIIPFFDKRKRLFAYQGRAVADVSSKQMRYITIVVDSSVPCLWGLDRVDLSRKTYVHEGALDALFIDNSLAIAGGNFASLQSLNMANKEDLVLCYDNEARSKDTKKKMIDAVEQGFSVLVWPPGIASKDINEMVQKEGLTPDYISYIIEHNTHSGLKAKAAISQWSKK